ncbi:hypothetical protein [Caldimonas sp. KR1-144]|uniref:hypothetical protein n=1 Tax=Caldimonas sp. KR1-144 TaxID=3400911 RepID=UPI003C0CE152
MPKSALHSAAFFLSLQMRKRSKYRPRPVLADPVAFVLSGMRKPDKATSGKVLTQTYLALEAMRTGSATKADWDDLANTLNAAWVLCNDFQVGAEYREQLIEAREALIALGRRADQNGMRFTLYAAELAALRTAIEIHDAQIEASTADQMARVAHRVMNLMRSAPRISPKHKETA